MGAIKNLRESSVLLTNLSPLTHYDIASAIYSPENVADVCDIIHDPSEYVDTLIGMVKHCAELRAKSLYNALDTYATEEDYEEMERLEADDNFHASLYEADCLPF